MLTKGARYSSYITVIQYICFCISLDLSPVLGALHWSRCSSMTQTLKPVITFRTTSKYRDAQDHRMELGMNLESAWYIIWYVWKA